MNRRDFGKMMMGSGVAAALPLGGMASAAATSAQRGKYIFAVALAHNRVDVSAEMMVDMFGIRPPTARRLLSKLVKNGVVDTPNAQGIARLAEPLQRIVPQVVEYNPAGGYVVKGRLDELTAKAKQAAKDALEHDTGDMDPMTVEPEQSRIDDATGEEADRNPISPSDDDPVLQEALDEAHSAE